MDANFAHSLIEQNEENSLNDIKYFVVIDTLRFPSLEGLVFKAKTNEGAMNALYNYMVDNNVKMEFGKNKGKLVSDISDLLGIDFDEIEEDDEEELFERIADFVDESMVCLSKLTIV